MFRKSTNIVLYTPFRPRMQVRHGNIATISRQRPSGARAYPPGWAVCVASTRDLENSHTAICRQNGVLRAVQAGMPGHQAWRAATVSLCKTKHSKVILRLPRHHRRGWTGRQPSRTRASSRVGATSLWCGTMRSITLPRGALSAGRTSKSRRLALRPPQAYD